MNSARQMQMSAAMRRRIILAARMQRPKPTAAPHDGTAKRPAAAMPATRGTSALTIGAPAAR